MWVGGLARQTAQRRIISQNNQPVGLYGTLFSVTTILAFATYRPAFSVDVAEIDAAAGRPPKSGRRIAAAHDQDTVCLGVEAARRVLSGLDGDPSIARLIFATSRPPLHDKTNATVIHAALDLPASVFAFDLLGGQRAAAAAIDIAVSAPGRTLVVLAEITIGLPGSDDEVNCSDGAAAFLLGDDSTDSAVIANVLGTSGLSVELLERWRQSTSLTASTWEERFSEHAYQGLATRVLCDLRSASNSLKTGRLHVTGTSRRTVAAAVRELSASTTDHGLSGVGSAGTAQPGFVLSNLLATAGPDEEHIMLVLADGAHALHLRTTGHVPAQRPSPEPTPLPYVKYLQWRGLLGRDESRRPEPPRVSAPAAWRASTFKHALNGGHCRRCDHVQLTSSSTCTHCATHGELEPYCFRDRRAVIRSVIVDRLAAADSPPLTSAVIDFDGGGRLECEIADSGTNPPNIGDIVEMTFRRMSAVGGIPNYFWKARQITGEEV